MNIEPAHDDPLTQISVIKKNKQNYPQLPNAISLDFRLKRSNLSLHLCKNLLMRIHYKALHRRFNAWKYNCAIIEWRMN